MKNHKFSIHPAYIKAEIARRYFLKMTGEDIGKERAWNRWRVQKSYDKKSLRAIIIEIRNEASGLLK